MYASIIKQQKILAGLRIKEIARQKILTAAVEEYGKQYQLLGKKGFTDKEKERLEVLRSKVDFARDNRDRFRDAIEEQIDKNKIVKGAQAFNDFILGKQARFELAKYGGPTPNQAADTRPFLTSMINKTTERLSVLAKMLDKPKIAQGQRNEINAEIIALTGALADLKQQAVDLSTAWLDLSMTFAQNTGQDLRAAAIQMIQGVGVVLATGNFGLGLTPEQSANLLGQQRGAYGTWLAGQSTAHQLAKAEGELGGLMGNFYGLQAGSADANRRDFLWGTLQAGGTDFDGTFMALSPEDRLSMFQELIGLLQQTADNTADTAANTEDGNSAAEEALRLLGIARMEGVMFTKQMAVLENYLRTQVGSFASGTAFVSRSGTAQVHYGEEIRSKHQVRSSGSGGSVEPMTLVIEGSDDLTRALAKALTPNVNRSLGRSVRTRQRGGF
jgi:hypothetical protein